MKSPRSHGSGVVDRARLRVCGEGVVIEEGALVFHPENVSLGARVYVGHQAILKGYYVNELIVGEGTWIGQQAFLHAAGGIVIGRDVGIGPRVSILTSMHAEPEAGDDAALSRPIMDGAIEMAAVELADGCDIGVGAIVLPGVRVGRRAQVGAGAVVTHDVPDDMIVAGNPARVLRRRGR